MAKAKAKGRRGVRAVPIEDREWLPLPSMGREEFEALAARMNVPSEVSSVLSMRQYQMYVVRLSEDPPLSLPRLADRVGLAVETCRTTWQRVREKVPVVELGHERQRGDRGRAQDVVLADGEIAPAAMLRKVNSALWKTLTEMERGDKISKASFAQLSSGAKALFDMRQLARGEPTQVVRYQDLGSFAEAGKLLAEAMARHGYTFTGIDPGSGEARLEKNVTPKRAT